MTNLDEYFNMPLTNSILENKQEPQYEPLRSAKLYNAYKSTDPYNKLPTNSALSTYK